MSLRHGIMAVPVTADQGYYMTTLGNMDLNINTSTSPEVQVIGDAIHAQNDFCI